MAIEQEKQKLNENVRTRKEQQGEVKQKIEEVKNCKDEDLMKSFQDQIDGQVDLESHVMSQCLGDGNK